MYNAEIVVNSKNSIFKKDDQRLVNIFDKYNITSVDVSNNCIEVFSFGVDYGKTPLDFFAEICKLWPHETIKCTATGENLSELDYSYSPPYYTYENMSGDVYSEGPFVENEEGEIFELCDLDNVSTIELW